MPKWLGLTYSSRLAGFHDSRNPIIKLVVPTTLSPHFKVKGVVFLSEVNASHFVLCLLVMCTAELLLSLKMIFNPLSHTALNYIYIRTVDSEGHTRRP